MKQKCHNHTEREAASSCHSCGYYFCSDCLNEGIEYHYCKAEKCQQVYQEELAAYEKKPKEVSLIKKVFTKKNLSVGSYCWWRAVLITVIGFSIAYFVLVFPLFILTPRGSYGREIVVDRIVPYIMLVVAFVSATLSFNWAGKRTIKKYYNIVTPKFACISLFITNALIFGGLSFIFALPIFLINVLFTYFSAVLKFSIWWIILPWLLVPLFLIMYINGYIVNRVSDNSKKT
jgi:hypothetical protein